MAGPPHQDGLFEQLSDWVFTRPVEGGHLLIRSYPFGGMAIDDAELAQLRAYFAGSSELGQSFRGRLNQRHMLDGEPVPNDQLSRHVSAIMLVTTHCNLACPGCFASGGDYGLGAAHMSSEVVQATLRYLEHQMRGLYEVDGYLGKADLGLHFFGGEPFIAFDRMKEAVEAAAEVASRLSSDLGREIKPNLFVTTNGTLLNDERVAFLAKHKIAVLLSLDGPDHDERRFYRSGKGSLAKAMHGFTSLQRAGVLVRLNTVVHSEDLPRYDEILAWFKSEVYGNVPSLSTYHTFSFEREGPGTSVGACGNCSAPGSIDQYIEELKSFNSEGYRIYEGQLKRKLATGGTYYKCSTGVKRIAIDPRGNVFPCQGFIDPRMSMGSILDVNFNHRSTPISRKLAVRSIATLRPCRDCVFAALCPHNVDCAARAFYTLGGIEQIDVDGMCKVGYELMNEILFERPFDWSLAQSIPSEFLEVS